MLPRINKAVTILALGIACAATTVSAMGCYKTSEHKCDCDMSETQCTAAKFVMTERCCAEVKNYAPDHTKPHDGADWKAFGKGVYYQRALDHKLHEKCESDEYCLDFPKSQGSCYFAGEDEHIGHAVFCDVTEEQCCGWVGCSKGWYNETSGKYMRGRFANGTVHMYYFYQPGYMSSVSYRDPSKGKCCHCKASCDHSAETAEAGTCEYRDVTTKDCQRDETTPTSAFETDQSANTKSPGFLKCLLPASKRSAIPMVREIIPTTTTSAPEPKSAPVGSTTATDASGDKKSAAYRSDNLLMTTAIVTAISPVGWALLWW